MANQTPDSQLSAHEKINWLLSKQCEQSQVVEDNKNRSPCVLEGAPNTLGDTASQSSQQKRKHQSHEEAQVYCQQVEHERWLKQQRRINERVNAEAQRLRQAEKRLAHQEQQKGCRGCFLWNEESTKVLLDLMMECGDHERENGHSDTKEEVQPNKNAQRTNEEMNQPGPSNFGQNIHASGRKNCRRSMSQESSISFASTRQDWSFLTNINNNMQGMLCPLMMMMQQNQERAEERDRRQMETDEE
ncbi:hypothetical protein O181_031134 [Austropuccinia psidii MF-1]|uniref:Uncharacterized protein n=1 Tax=Austropuccinia psidii MF-1 TaxID=1389203 RepID=A0A9Q3CV52_9BASI|nr:hypothetical protein [Austropuccinia psidii MF-1]